MADKKIFIAALKKRIADYRGEMKDLVAIRNEFYHNPYILDVETVERHLKGRFKAQRFESSFSLYKQLNHKADNVTELLVLLTQAIDRLFNDLEFSLNTWKALAPAGFPPKNVKVKKTPDNIYFVFYDHTSTQLTDVEMIIERFEHVLYTIEKEKEVSQFQHPVNFIKDNKLPAPDDDHKRVRIPLKIAEDLANTLDLLDKEMATILTISIRTYHRLKSNGLLNPVASERLVMLKKLADYGLEVFEYQNSFNQWLRLPLQELSNRSPLNLMETATGFNQVKTILSRIDYGVYS